MSEGFGLVGGAGGHTGGFRSVSLELASFRLRPLRFDVDVGEDESIFAELFDVIEHVTDQIDRDFIKGFQPAVNNLEDVFA